MSAELRTEPAETYHANETHVSRGMLWTLRKSPREFHWKYVLRRKSKPEGDTSILDIGTVAHAVILEGRDIDSCCVTIPDEVLSKGARRGDAWRKFEESHAGMVLLKRDEVDDTIEIARAVLAHREVGKWHAHPKIMREKSIYWTCQDSGLSLRIRPDWMIETPRCVFVIDFKTTGDITPRAFAGSAREHGYDLQQAMYTDGIERLFGKPVIWNFLVAKRKPGYTVATFNFDERTIQSATDRYKRLKSDLARRLEDGDWRDDEEKQDNTISIPEFEYHHNSEVANV